MQHQEDAFYSQLPFTLTPQQTTPSFVILGTGLQQCLIAAHHSKIHSKPGLILDLQKTYGSCLKTVTIKQLHSLSTLSQTLSLYKFLPLSSQSQKNLEFIEKTIAEKTHRGYNIDLEPNLFFANSMTCELLKQADMDKYMDFRLVYNMLNYDHQNNKLMHVPLSKGKIFESKNLSLMEKKTLLNTLHSLTQIYHKFNQVSFDQNSTKQFDKQFAKVDQKLYQEFIQNINEPFLPFLSKITKNNPKILNFIIYILCNYQHNYNHPIPPHIKQQYNLKNFINKFGKFIKSCGIYSENPYLYVDNGIGDVPQSYSRIASIYLSTFILHPKIQISKIQAGNPILIHTNLSPSIPISTPQLYIGPTAYNIIFPESAQSQCPKYLQQFTLRIILLCQKRQEQESCPSIAYFLDLDICENPLYLFMFDSTSHNCPDNKILYQFQTIINPKQLPINQQTYQQLTQKIINKFTSIKANNFEQSILYTSAYIRQKRYPKQKLAETNQHLLKDHNGIDLDTHFYNFVEVVGQQNTYFRKNKGQNHQGNDGENDQTQWTGDQTVGLIQRLESIRLDAQPEEAKNEQEQLQEQKEVQNKEFEVKQQNEELRQKELQIENNIKEKQEQNMQHKQEMKVQQILQSTSNTENIVNPSQQDPSLEE